MFSPTRSISGTFEEETWTIKEWVISQQARSSTQSFYGSFLCLVKFALNQLMYLGRITVIRCIWNTEKWVEGDCVVFSFTNEVEELLFLFVLKSGNDNQMCK